MRERKADAAASKLLPADQSSPYRQPETGDRGVLSLSGLREFDRGKRGARGGTAVIGPRTWKLSARDDKAMIVNGFQ